MIPLDKIAEYTQLKLDEIEVVRIFFLPLLCVLLSSISSVYMGFFCVPFNKDTC